MNPLVGPPETDCEAMPSEDGSGSTKRGGAYDHLFEAGIAHLHQYVAEHGSSSPPRGVTINGFLLGSWVDSRRTDYRLGRLSAERIARLESEFPDWRWTVRDAMFETGLTHLRRYVAVHGTSYIRQHEVFDGFPLGQWVTNRRTDYRVRRLSAERIALFENEFPDWRWTVRGRS